MVSQDRSNVLAQPGELDPEFAEGGVFAVPTTTGSIRSIVADGQGRFLLAVWISPEIRLYRIFADGTLDRQFGQNGVTSWTFVPGVDSVPAKLMVQRDGKFLLFGSYGQDIFQRQTAFTRFNESGSPDLVFGTKSIAGAELSGPDACLQADGKILVLVRRSLGGNEHRTVLHRFLPNGEIDEAFGGQGFIDVRFNNQHSQGETVAVTEDGNILVAGTARRENPTRLTKAVARFFPSGGVDSSFANEGYWESGSDITLENIMVYPSGIVCVGRGRTTEQIPCASISRLTHDGKLDPTFNNGQTVAIEIPFDIPVDVVYCGAVTVQADGKIVAGGYVGPFDNAYCLRLLPDGRLDPDFADQGIKVYIQPTILYDLQQVGPQRLLAAIDTKSPRRPYVFGLQT